VRSHLTEDFISCFRKLPPRVQRLARRNYRLWKQNPFHPGLQFKRVGEVIRQYHGSHAKVQRAKMMLVLGEDPALCTPELARVVGVHPNTAFKWRKRWTAEGFTVEDHPRSGRPLTFLAPR